MEVFACENRPPAANGLMLDTTGRVAASVTDGQAFGDYRRGVAHRRQIVGGDPAGAIVRHTNGHPPGGGRSTNRAVNPRAAMLYQETVAYVHLDTTDAAPLCPMYAGPFVLHATKPFAGVQGPLQTVVGFSVAEKKYVSGP